MPQLNVQVWHLFGVLNLSGQPVTGLTGASFTKTLRRQSGATLIATSETVSIAEVGGGEYWATYTPTVDPTLYVLDLAATSGSNIVNPAHWQDEVEPAAALPTEIWHVFSVVSLTGAPVTGLTVGAFQLTLRRRSGAGLVATPETISFQAVGAGEYWLSYLPTEDSTLYVLGVSAISDAHIVNPGQWQDDVQLGSLLPVGPYLTTRTRLKAAFDIKGGDHDTRIDQLLPQVTDLFQSPRGCGRKFVQGEETEYPTPLSRCVRILLAGKPPIVSVTSLHFSTTIPRVYDATTLLVEGTDFLVSEDGQWIELVTPRVICGSLTKVAKLVYVGGYATVPGDIERAAQEVIVVKLMKGASKQYHFLNESVGDGQLQGLRWDDITPDAMAVIESNRLRAVV